MPLFSLPAKKFSRRAFIKTIAKILAIGFVGKNSGAFAFSESKEEKTDAGLRILAAPRGWLYGAAVQSGDLKDTAFATALKREVNLLVPENELKWSAVRPAENTFNFSGYRRIAAFAQANSMTMRGHTLVWHNSNPSWLEKALQDKTRALSILKTHIRGVLKETGPLIREWDVVNEAIDPSSSRMDGLRETLWLKALGPNYVATAFRIAHDTDPTLALVYNDYGAEYSDRGGHRKRELILNMLQNFMQAGVPLTAFGLQSHLRASRPLAGKEFVAFLKDVRALGLKIHITELDLDVRGLSGSIDDAIKAAQSYVRAYFDMVQETGPIEELLTWGLSDKYTWLHQYWPEAKGALPLNHSMNRGPLWETIRERWLSP